MNKHKHFRFDPANRKESLARRLKVYAFDDHMRLAHCGDAKPLCDYLRDHTVPLMQEHREELAELIHRFVQLKSRGRPPGAGRTRRAEVKGIWVARVRDLKHQWRMTHAGERLPKGLQRTFIERVGGELAEDADLHKIPKITTDEIEADLKRGKSKQHLKSR